MKNDQPIIISAPATTVLLGEHAVLHGYPALVCALQQRIYVELQTSSDGCLRVDSNLAKYDTPMTKITDHPKLRFVLAAVQKYRLNFKGLHIKIHSDFAHNLGLGSSAAVTVAVVAALQQTIMGRYNTHAVLLTSLKLVRRVQGVGSGCDLAASAYGGMIVYKTDPPRVTQLHKGVS